MLIVIDACVLFKDFLLRGTAFEIISKYGKDLHFKLAIPESVFEEVIVHQAEEYEKAYSKLLAAKDTIECVSHDKILFKDGSGPDPLFGPDWYRSHLQRRVSMMGAIISPTKMLFGRVLQRSLAKRRPFPLEGDRGLKDALIWETILDLLRKTKDRIVFITKDHGFLDDKQGTLHEHLLADLAQMQCADRVIFRESLAELVAKDLAIRLKRKPRLENMYRKPGNPVFSIPDFLSSFEALTMLQLTDLEPQDCDLPAAATRIAIREFSNWQIGPDVEVVSIGEKKRLCLFEASVDCLVHWRDPEPRSAKMITSDSEGRLIAIEHLPDYSLLWRQSARHCRMKLEMVIDYHIGRWVSLSNELVECRGARERER
jgi:hypothetical protein